MTIPALIIFRDEFKQRNFLDWLISHTSGSLPPHRYRGEIDVTSLSLMFTGVDIKLKTSCEFFIEKSSIEEVYFGYDEVFNVYQTRGFGLTWAPVRIKFMDTTGQERFGYFITGYNQRGTANKDFYKFLIEWLS